MKKSANTASNGVDGGVVGRGGVAVCEGAFLLQSAHQSLTFKSGMKFSCLSKATEQYFSVSADYRAEQKHISLTI